MELKMDYDQKHLIKFLLESQDIILKENNSTLIFNQMHITDSIVAYMVIFEESNKIIEFTCFLKDYSTGNLGVVGGYMGYPMIKIPDHE